MFFKESTRYPLVDSKSNIFNKFCCSGLISLRCFFNSFEEKFDKALQRVLIHMINNTQWNTQEVQHSTLSCNRSINLSLSVNIYLSNFSNFWLFSNRDSCSFCFFKIVNQFLVLKDSWWISIRQLLQKTALQFIKNHLEVVLFLDQLLLFNL